jgi:hypothetical protein
MAKNQEPSVKEVIERLQETFTRAEQNVAKALKDVSERLAETQVEAKRKVEELLGHLSAKELKELTARLPDESLSALKSFREDFETRFEEGTSAFFGLLGLASKAEVEDLNRKLVQLSRRLKELEGAKKPARARAQA